jgi:RecA-family ATPase
MFVRILENDKFMQPVILIKKNRTELLTNSSLMLIKGEPGSGKSRLAMNMMLGLLTGKEDLNLEYALCPDKKHVLYISTEMNRYHLQKRLLKILENVPERDKSKLVFLDSIDVPANEKLKYLQESIKAFSPHVIIIDQLADFVSNINDIEQANQIISKLMNGMENTDCAIIGIIHQNDNSGIESKARGHLGSTFEQKVVSSIAIADTKYGFKLKTTKIREGTHIEINAKFNEVTEMLIESKIQIITELTDLEYPMKRDELIKVIMKNESCGSRTAITKIDKLVENKILEKSKDKKEVYFNLIKE